MVGSAPSFTSVFISSASAVSGGQEERRRAELVRARVVQVRRLRHARVDVRAVRDELLHELEARHGARPFRRGIVVADARLADRGDRREARCSPARRRSDWRRRRASAAASSKCAFFTARKQRRGADRRQAAAVAATASGPGRRRRASARSRRRRPSAATRTTSRRPSRTANSSGVKPDGTRARKSAPASMSVWTTVGVTFGRGPHEGGLSTTFVLASTFAPARQERLDRPGRAGSRGRHERGFTAGQAGIRIGAGLQEQLDHRAVAVGARQRQRRHAVAARRRRRSRRRRRAGPRSADRRDTPPSAAPSCHRPAAR